MCLAAEYQVTQIYYAQGFKCPFARAIPIMPFRADKILAQYNLCARGMAQYRLLFEISMWFS